MKLKAVREVALEHAERLRMMGPIEVSRYFGGFGLRIDGVLFAFVMHDALYLRVDDETRRDFEDRGCLPFSYTGASGPVTVTAYYETPGDVVELESEFLAWANRAHQAAVRSRLRTPKRRSLSRRID